MARRIATLPGDGAGPDTIGAAVRAVEAAAPGIDIVRGEIGEKCYERTGSVIPAETSKLVLAADSVLCGPVRRPEGARDPMSDLRKQLRLYAQVGEFWPLCSYIGNREVDLIVVSMTPELSLTVTEIDSLDGVSSDLFTSADAASSVFAKTITVAEAKRRKKITLVSGWDLTPNVGRMVVDGFRRHFAAAEFEAEDIRSGSASCRLAVDPSSLDVVVTGPAESPFVRGQAAGMVGGCGLMPNGFVGDKSSLFAPEPAHGPHAAAREANPTSAILSAAMMLGSMGLPDAYSSIKKAVREMYRLGRTTPDMGGKTSPGDFADGVVDLIRSYRGYLTPAGDARPP